jgi:hypothetical protein
VRRVDGSSKGAGERHGRRLPGTRRSALSRWGLAAAGAGLLVALCGAGQVPGRAQGPAPGTDAGAPRNAARIQAINAEALATLDQIRRAYPIDFGEEPAIHKAVRNHLLAGGDPGEVRHLVKIAIIQGCRHACMTAATTAFTELNAAGVAPAVIRRTLEDAMKEARHQMPREYTYEMLAARLTRIVDAAEPPAPTP